MLISVKNLTSNPISELGLNANQTKVVWNNKPFFHENGDKRQIIFQKIRSGEIVFLNEFGENTVYWDAPNNQIVGELLIDEMSNFVGENRGSDELIVKAERQAALDIFQIVATVFRRNKPVGYNMADKVSAMKARNIYEFILDGALKNAATGFTNITTDAFFTADVGGVQGRKSFFAAICNALDLG